MILTGLRRVGNTLDHELAAQGFDGFVAVRKAEREVKNVITRLKDGIKDPKATELANLANCSIANIGNSTEFSLCSRYSPEHIDGYHTSASSDFWQDEVQERQL